MGRFEVIELARNPTWEHPVTGQHIPPGPANPLGSRWIGFHRDCKGRAGFNGREHLVVKGCVSAGFHGTPSVPVWARPSPMAVCACWMSTCANCLSWLRWAPR